MWAAWYGNTEVVTQLLAAPGCNKDKLNNAGKNAVMYAAEAGREMPRVRDRKGHGLGA